MTKSRSELIALIKAEHPNWSDHQCTLYQEYVAAVEDLIPFMAPMMPKLGNKGVPELVDIAGGQNALRKATKKLEDLLKGVIDTKLTVVEGETSSEYRGEVYILTVAKGVETTRMNQTKAKELLLAKGVPEDDFMDTSEGSRRTFSKIGG